MPGTTPRQVTAAQVRLIWLVLTASTFVYGAIPLVLRRRGGGTSPPELFLLPPESAPLAAGVATLICMAAAWFLGGMLGPAGQVAGGEPQLRALPRVLLGVIVACSIGELPALLGLVGFFLGMTAESALWFVGGALLIQGVNYFRMQAWLAGESAGQAD